MASKQKDIPQWKKDLILRKRTQNKCPPTSSSKQNSEQLEQLSYPTATVRSEAGSNPKAPEWFTAKQATQTRYTIPVSSDQDGDIHVIEKCDTKSFVNNTNVNEVKNTMVQDSVLIVHKPLRIATMVAEDVSNGVHVKNDVDSDSSEELQYGPGIVSKLKSKYLSLTLREKKIAKPRQTILNMRRATSLENMLDADSADELIEPNLNQKNSKPVPIQSRRFAQRTENTNGNARNISTRYRTTNRTNDSMKRARSVETLHSSDNNCRELVNEDVVIIEKEGNTNHRKQQDNKMTVQTSESKSFSCNGGQVINRPKRIMPIMDDTERPPADHVKHTMMLFEGPPVRRTKGPRPTGEVAAKVANFKNIIEKEKSNKKNVKPQITPKPVGHNKTRKVLHRPVSPKKNSDSVNETDKIRPVSPLEKIRSFSPSEKLELVSTLEKNIPTGPLSPLEKVRSPSPLNKIEHLSSVKIRPESPINKITPLSPTKVCAGNPLNKIRPESPSYKIEVLSPTEKIMPTSVVNKTEPLIPAKVRPPSPLNKIEPLITSEQLQLNKVRPLSPSNKSKSDVLTSEIKLISPVYQTPDVASSQIPDVSRINELCDKTGLDSEAVRPRIMSETPDLILHSSLSSTSLASPEFLKKITENFINSEKRCSENNSIVTSPTIKSKQNNPRNLNTSSQMNSSSGLIRIQSPVEDNVDGVIGKEINKQSIENISQACNSITFSISDNISKSHLPRLSTVPVGINRLVPDTPSKPAPKPPAKPIQESSKKCEAVNELVSQSPKSITSQISKEIRSPNILINNISKTKQKDVIVKNNVDIVSKSVNRPPTPLQNKNLTNREITKNLINNAKTFEQPVSKVVVSVRSVEDVVVNNSAPSFLGKPVKQGRHQEQTSLLFNFQDRETVPDYIAHDNSVPIRRGKREKPKPGESGMILLPDAPVDEFEEDDYLLSLNGPPSPCDVFFENDNVLIDGKSSICKHPKRQKLRIQFNDDATQLFMYPSESSLMDESPTSLPPPATQPVLTNAPGHTVPSLSGSSLASYQPSKMSVTAGFQLGVTRSSQPPIVTPPTSTTKETESTIEEPELPITYSSETNADILF